MSKFLLRDQGGLCAVLQYLVDVKSNAKNHLEKMNAVDIRYPYEMSIKEQHLE